MKEVNLYIGITAHGPRKQDGAYGWVLELVRAGGSPYTKEGFGVREDVTDRDLALEALAEALEHFTEPCSINILLSPSYMAETFPTPWTEGWVQKWKENGWKNSKGKEIVHADLWEKAEAALRKHEAVFCPKGVKNSYANWISDETKRRTHRILGKKEETGT